MALASAEDEEKRAPGVIFAPTDADLVQYCKPEIIDSELDIPCINRYDIYSTNPSDLPFKFVYGAHRNEAYFYSPRNPIGSRRSNKAGRTACCKISRTVPAGPNTDGGVWHPNGDTQVMDEKSRVVVGHRASFTFKKRSSVDDDDDDGKKGLSGTSWMMYEYRRADEHKDGMGVRLCKIYKKEKHVADDMITLAEFEAATSADISYKRVTPGDCSTEQYGGCAGGSPAVVYGPRYPSQTRDEDNYLEDHAGMISSNMSFTLEELDMLVDTEPRGERGGGGGGSAQSYYPSPSLSLPADRAAVITKQFGSLPIAESTQSLQDPASNFAAKDISLSSDDDSEEWDAFSAKLTRQLDS